ncbi:MAG: metallophosphoesterase [Chlorobi bacterium]|nr:metallophosphoesterase [Chlorobiota bacterium]
MSKLLFFWLSFLLIFSFSNCDKNDEINDDDTENTESEITASIDGPYIFYDNDKIIDYTVDAQGKLDSAYVSYNDELKVIVPYRDPEAFNFILKEELPENESVYGDDNNKIFAVSDIEGNYYVLTKLLIGNGIVDNELNWTFGTNHLVLNGDMVDRGQHVTQVLWLIYKLQYQAKQAGGTVHFILGNHDVMCMAGDSRYADPKYPEMAHKLNIEYKELYGTDTETGRWMRSQNAIEKINGYVFVHAGISPDILELGLSFEEINELMRPYYGMTIDDSVPEQVYKLFKTSGVLWYRGYFQSKDGAYDKATIDQVNEILNYYDAKNIIVGHSIVEEITPIYEGKVIAMDVHHPDSDYSDLPFQALLIENNELYRVDEKGNKTRLN